MVDESIEPIVRNAWYIAAWSDELSDKPLARTILGEDLAIFRDAQGHVGALEDRCCHRAAPLTHGEVIEEGLQCGYHGMVFDRTGVCSLNPGEDINAAIHCVRSYPVIEKQKALWIWMGEAERADENLIVDFPFHDMSDEWDFKFGRYDIGANYMFMMDNLMDLTHLGYVHRTTIGGFPDSHVKAVMDTKKTEHGVHYLRWMLNSPPPPSFVNAAGFEGEIDRWSDFEYVAPASVLQWGGAHDAGKGAQENREQDGGLSIRLLHHATPETETTCHYFFSVAARNVAADSDLGKAFHSDILAAFLEDKSIIEAQQKIIDKDPGRSLMFRQHDEAVALGRQALHRMQADDAKLQVQAAE